MVSLFQTPPGTELFTYTYVSATGNGNHGRGK